jgi:hypothetical protein
MIKSLLFACTEIQILQPENSLKRLVKAKWPGIPHLKPPDMHFCLFFGAKKLEKALKRPFLPSKSRFSLTFCLKKVNASPQACFIEEKKVNVAAQVRFTKGNQVSVCLIDAPILCVYRGNPCDVLQKKALRASS